MNRETDYNTRETQLKVAPLPLAIVHLMENGVPLGSSYVCAIVLVKSFSRTTIVSTNLQSFPDLHIVGKPFFVFVGHVFYDLWLPVNRNNSFAYAGQSSVFANAQFPHN